MATKIIWELLMYENYTDSRTLLTDLYVIKKWSMERIAEKLGIDKAVVRNELIRLGIRIRPKGRPKFPENVIKMLVKIYSKYATLATLTFKRRAIKM